MPRSATTTVKGSGSPTLTYLRLFGEPTSRLEPLTSLRVSLWPTQNPTRNDRFAATYDCVPSVKYPPILLSIASTAEATADVLLTKRPTRRLVAFGFCWFCRQKGEPTSGLEPLTCSLRVIIHLLQGFARTCKTRISKEVSFLRVAARCTVLRSRWCQSGVRSPRITRRQFRCARCAANEW